MTIFVCVSASSRAGSTVGSRPTSRAASEAASEAGSDDMPDVFTTVTQENRNVGGRRDTTLTYQTHNIQTRTVTLPTVTHTKISRIPKMSPSTPKPRK